MLGNQSQTHMVPHPDTMLGGIPAEKPLMCNEPVRLMVGGHLDRRQVTQLQRELRALSRQPAVCSHEQEQHHTATLLRPP